METQVERARHAQQLIRNDHDMKRRLSAATLEFEPLRRDLANAEAEIREAEHQTRA